MSDEQEPAPWAMLYFVDATHHYNEEFVQKCGGKITDVWLFDVRLLVHCCELTPSYEMEYFDSVPWEHEDDDEKREELDEMLTAANEASGQSPIQYFQCRGHLRSLTTELDQKNVPKVWDYKTTPFVMEAMTPDPEMWQELKNDQDGDVRQAQIEYMREMREYLQGNAPY